MYGPSNGYLLAFALVIGAVGWAVIEGVLWVLRHLSWAWE